MRYSEGRPPGCSLTSHVALPQKAALRELKPRAVRAEARCGLGGTRLTFMKNTVLETALLAHQRFPEAPGFCLCVLPSTTPSKTRGKAASSPSSAQTFGTGLALCVWRSLSPCRADARGRRAAAAVAPGNGGANGSRALPGAAMAIPRLAMAAAGPVPSRPVPHL